MAPSCCIQDQHENDTPHCIYFTSKDGVFISENGSKKPFKTEAISESSVEVVVLSSLLMLATLERLGTEQHVQLMEYNSWQS